MSDYHASMRALGRRLSARGTIAFATGSSFSLTGEHIAAFTLDEGVSDGQLPGSAAAGAYTLSLANERGQWLPGGACLGARTLQNAVVTLELGVDMGGEYAYAPCGVFTVESVRAKAGEACAVLSGADAALAAFEAAFSDGQTYPRTLGQTAAYIAALSGLALETGGLPNTALTLPAKPDWGEISRRQALAFCAAAMGCFVRFERAGGISLVRAKGSGISHALTPAHYLDLTRSENAFSCAALAVSPYGMKRGETPLVRGAGTAATTLCVRENPIFARGSSALAALCDGLFAAVDGLAYAGGGAVWRGDPTVCLGDELQVADTRGGAWRSVITRQTLAFERGFSMTSENTVRTQTPRAVRLVTPAGALNASALAGEINGLLIRDGSVTANALLAGAVTAEKIDAGAVTAEKIDVGAVTAEKLDAGAVTAEKIDAGAVTAEKIGAGSVTAEKIDAGAVTAEKIDAGAVTAEKIGAGAVTAEKIDAGAVTAEKIDAGAVTAEKIGAGAVTAEKLSAGSVTADKFAAGSVTAENLSAASLYAQHMAAQIAKIVQANITRADIEGADIDWAQIVDLEAVFATVANAEIGSADIGFAQIKDLVAGTAIITEGVGGRLYVSRLAVTEANIASLTTGELILKDSAGNLRRLYLDADTGAVASEIVQLAGGNLQDESIDAGEKLLTGSITAALLDVEQIFASEALIGAIRAANIAAGTITAQHLASGVGAALDLSSNEAIRSLVTGQVSRAEADALSAAVAAQNEALGGLASQAELEAAQAEAARLAETVVELESRVTQLAGSVTVEVSERRAAQTALTEATAALEAAQEALALYVRITAEGVEIGRPGDPVTLTADNAELSAATVTARERLNTGGFSWRDTSHGLVLQSF